MTHQLEWLSDLARLAEDGTPCVLVTVTEAKGSTPREAGTKMVVTGDRQFGTIGGGNLEFQAVGEARELLQKTTQAPANKDYALGPQLAQCCGGTVSVLLEPFFPRGNPLYLFGAGHVGKEVVKVLSGLSVDVRWIDERENEFPRDLPARTRKIVTASPAAEIAGLPEGAFVLVMTHSHDTDYEIVSAALKKGNFAYLGLIGSETKRARFESRLAAGGLGRDKLARLTCPIGGSSGGKHPREIAIATSAEMLEQGLLQPHAAALKAG